MKGSIYIITAFFMIAALITTDNAAAEPLWRAPFDTNGVISESDNSALSLDDALMLVAAENPIFKSFGYQIMAAGNDLEQAGVWSNPEIEMEIEEFGWDAPGFKESEFTVALSQELEILGQRGARKSVANAHQDATELQVRISAFDLYLKTKERFYTLAHAQQKVVLSIKSVELTRDIVENINHRLERGAALKSELLLANLEEQQALLELDNAKQEVVAFEASLVSLWKAKPSGMQVSFENEDKLNSLFDKIANMSNSIDSTRDMIQMGSEWNLLNAERNLAVAEARPAITLSGGIKRFEVDNSKSFLFGVSLPLPIFNRNQGDRKSMDAQLQSMRYEIENERNEIQSSIESLAIRLTQLRKRHMVLDTLLLPTASDAYQTLRSAYDAGRIPYTQMLEAKRILNDLSFEHNDLILEIYQQVMQFESITGAVLYVKEEN